jgi:D-arginine dehydrogenase
MGYDVAVVGGGIAGVSAACELAEAGLSTALVEREDQLAHHTTGRSAAVYLESLGSPVVQALTGSSRADYLAAPDRFAVGTGIDPLLTPRPMLMIAAAEQLAALESELIVTPSLRRLDPTEALALCPALRPERLAGAAIEEDAADIDVMGLHDGYRRLLVATGGHILRSWPIVGIEPAGRGWRLRSPDSSIDVAAVVIAAGAWCDQVAALAGARPIGLTPLRRTIAVCRLPDPSALHRETPMVTDAADTFYFRPEGPHALCSPADETPSEPVDARPDELDVALAIDRINQATTLGLRSVVTTWAGLRTFAPDRVPVVGQDPDIPNLWWLAGQGGYGIQTAPAMARCLVSLLLGRGLPADLIARGVEENQLAPGRFLCPD